MGTSEFDLGIHQPKTPRYAIVLTMLPHVFDSLESVPFLSSSSDGYCSVSFLSSEVCDLEAST